MAIDYLSLRNIYPTAQRETVANVATGPGAITAEAITTVPAAAEGEVGQALLIGGQANPLVGLAVFAGMVIMAMLIGQHLGDAEEFRNLRLSAYNVVVTSLIAVAGIPLWKAIFTRVKLPGVSTWVLSV